MQQVVDYIKKETGQDSIIIEDGRIRCYLRSDKVKSIPNFYVCSTGYFLGPVIVNFINDKRLVIPIDFVIQSDTYVAIYKTLNGHMMHHDSEPALVQLIYNSSCTRRWFKNGEPWCSYGPDYEYFYGIELNGNIMNFKSVTMEYTSHDEELFPRKVSMDRGGRIVFKNINLLELIVSGNDYNLYTNNLNTIWLPSSSTKHHPTMFSRLCYDDVALYREQDIFMMTAGQLTHGEVYINNIKQTIPSTKFEEVDELLLNFNILGNYLARAGDVVAFTADITAIIR